MLKDHIANNNYFLFGCDSCTIVEMLYNDCIKDVTEQDKDKFIIISVNHKLEIKNASEQFKKKFVFIVHQLQLVLIFLLKINRMYLFIFTVNQ